MCNVLLFCVSFSIVVVMKMFRILRKILFWKMVFNFLELFYVIIIIVLIRNDILNNIIGDKNIIYLEDKYIKYVFVNIGCRSFIFY